MQQLYSNLFNKCLIFWLLIVVLATKVSAQNYGFEAPASTPPQSWTPVTGTWVTINATQFPNFVRSGNQAVSITDPATTGTTIGNTVPTVTTTTGGNFLISMVWARSNVDDNARINIGYRSGTTNTLNPSATNAGQAPNMNSQGWSRVISISAGPVPAGTYSPAMRAFRTTSIPNTTLYLDDFIIYASPVPIADTIAPQPAQNINVNQGAGYQISWVNGEDQGTPASGIDGVVIIRTNSSQTVAPSLNNQCMYSPAGGGAGVNAFTAAGIDWTVVASLDGDATVFQDTSAIPGNTYTYVVYLRDKAFNYSVGAIGNSGGPIDMSYFSGNTIQITGNANPGVANQPIIRIQVIMSGSLNPLSLTAFQLSTNGSTNPATDITNAKLYYTGASSTFNTSEQVGATFTGPNGTFTINTNKVLATGLNNFFLTYDVPPSATINNTLDAECLSYTIAGQTFVPTTTAPTGNRRIRNTMSGIYTIGGSDPDYVTIQEAVSDLKELGVSGAVTFNIRPGTYTGQHTLELVPGISATNSVTFQAENGDSSSVIIDFPSSTTADNNFLFRLNNINHIRFNRLTLSRSGTALNANIILLNNTNDVRFTWCHFRGNDQSTSTSNINGVGIFCPAGFSANNTLIEHNLFTGVTGVSLRSVATGVNSSGNIIRNNTFRVFFTAVFLADQTAPVVINNDIRRNNAISTLSFFGVNLEQCSGNIQVLKNKIYALNGQRGIRAFFCEAGPNNELLIGNNIIQTGGTGLNYGISAEGNSKNVGIYHNTIYIQSTNNVEANMRGIFIDGALSQNIRIANNCVFIQNIGYGIYALLAATSTISYSDHNNYFVNNGNNVAFWGSAQPTMAALVATSGKEQNSISVNPQFVSIDNLTPENDDLFGAGIFIPSVADDFFGRPRNSNGPTIGAIELGPFQKDIALVNVLGVATEFCSNTALTVRLVVRNTGRDTITSFSAGAIVNGPAIFTISNTFNVVLPFNKLDTVTLGVLNVTVAGSYIGKAFLSLTGDEFVSNDTITGALTVAQSQQLPTVATPNPSVCGGSSVFLAASGNLPIRWYADAGLSNFIASGDSILTGPVNNNTTYYAVIDNLELPESAGLVNNGGQGGFITSQPNWGMNFTVVNRLLLDLVHVFPTGSGTIRLIVMKLPENQPIFTGPTVNISGNGSNKVQVPVGATLEPGSYRLTMQYTGITNLARENNGFTFPFVSPSGALRITSSHTGTQVNPNFYYWFYDWRIKISKGCPGIAPISVQVGNTPPSPLFSFTVNQSTVSFQNLTNSGATYQWNFGDGIGSSTEVNPIYTYNTTGNFVVQLTADNACTAPTSASRTVPIIVLSADEALSRFGNTIAYPMPTSGSLNISTDLKSKNLNCSLIDMAGRKVFESQANGGQLIRLELGGISKGVYLLNLSDGKQQRSVRVVLQ